jgi:hypothetical protein
MEFGHGQQYSQKGFLDQVLRLVTVKAHAPSAARHAILITPYQLVKRCGTRGIASDLFLVPEAAARFRSDDLAPRVLIVTYGSAYIQAVVQTGTAEAVLAAWGVRTKSGGRGPPPLAGSGEEPDAAEHQDHQADDHGADGPTAVAAGAEDHGEMTTQIVLSPRYSNAFLGLGP